VEKGFLDLISSDAFRELLAGFPPLEAETVPLEAALGRYLAHDLLSPEDLPVFARSSMDGFAVRAADCYGATETNPGYLDLAGDLARSQVAPRPLNARA